MSRKLRIEANGPVDTGAIISTLVNHEITGLTETSAGDLTCRRIVELAGEPTELKVEIDSAGVTVFGSGPDDLPAGTGELVRHWFDLDTDIAAVDRHLGSHPRFAEQVASRPGIRVTRHPSVYESAILIVLGQQISLAAASTFAGRMVLAYGEPAGELHRFPLPGRLAGEPVDELRANLKITGARAKTISDVAALFAGEDDLLVDDEVLLDRLAGIRGVGPWTLSCLALRGLDRPDEFPASDAVLRRALEGISAVEATSASVPWSPFRSYATVRLWAELAGAAA